MIHLRSIRVAGIDAPAQDAFPFNVPVIRALRELEFTTPVTFFVGENGSGKSALLETLACAANSITAGSEPVKTDKTLQPARNLAKHFRLAWTKRTHKGLFLRAEDFFGYVKGLAQMRAEMEDDLKRLDDEYATRTQEALNYARIPYLSELNALKQRYGRGLDAYSHGEGFLEFFNARFVPGGLYLLDEPEAALSPKRQLTFLALLKQMVAQDAQFVVATHSPIILGFPGATILSFDEVPIRPVKYEELEHVWLTRAFLNNPEPFLRQL